MPKSVGYWKEIENVSQPLTFSYGARCSDLIITELESWTRSTGSRPCFPSPKCYLSTKFISSYSTVYIHYPKITKHRITGNPYLFPAVTSTAVKNCLSHWKFSISGPWTPSMPLSWTILFTVSIPLLTCCGNKNNHEHHVVSNVRKLKCMFMLTCSTSDS